MGSWGTELWDRYSCVLTHVTRGGDELVSVYAKYVKERGDLEREYARNVKKLVSKYTQKTQTRQGIETTQGKGFRLLLQETGLQASQHEIIGDTLAGKLYQDLQQKGKEIMKVTKQNLKRAKQISEEINRIYKDLEKSKCKYQKSYVDWETARNNYLKAEEDDKMSRIEIAKMKSLTESRNTQCEENKVAYASLLLKTNKCQEEYYFKDLPSVLTSLQSLETDRIDFVKNVMGQFVAVQKQVAPIIAKSYDDKECIIQTINPANDSQILIERLKTGALPPQDIPFEKMTSETEFKSGTLKRKKSKLKLKNPDKDVSKEQEKKEEEFFQSYLTTPLTIRKIDNSPGGSRSNSFQSGSVSCGTLSNWSCSDESSDVLENNDRNHEEFDSLERVVALYPFTGDCSESSIAMEAGEEFIVTEGDEGGWTKVRRMNPKNEEDEGFVPTAYLHWIND